MKNLCSMNFSGEIDDRKEQEKGKSKQTCALVPNKYFFFFFFFEKEGATVAASPLTFAAGCFDVCHRPDQQRSSMELSKLSGKPY